VHTRFGLIALAIGIACLACEETTHRPSFILISIDTLRADHLGSYGYERDTSPHLDQFASRAIRFERAIAPAPWTLPSHLAMLTGSHPYDVGIVDINSSLPATLPTLASLLERAGYQTAAFVDSAPRGMIGAERGFDRGFDRYQHAPHAETTGPKYDVALTVDAGIDWLRERNSDEPFFLFLHTKSVHSAPARDYAHGRTDAPYVAPPPFGSQFLPKGSTQFLWHESREQSGAKYLRHLNKQLARGEMSPSDFSEKKRAELIALYDGGIRYVDDHFGRLMRALQELGLSSDTVIIVAADHGEAFLEHYYLLHREVFDTQISVPLMVFDPADPLPSVRKELASLLDIAPTILARAGISPGTALLGRNLLEVRDGTIRPRKLFSYSKLTQDPIYEGYALEDGRYRLIYHKHLDWDQFRVELFDRLNDPDERSPLEGKDDLKQVLLAQLFERMSATQAHSRSEIELDQKTLENLRALGYVD
jgi:arylsulfatase